MTDNTRLGRLGSRGEQVLNLMKRGAQNNTQIAEALGITKSAAASAVNKLRDIFGRGLSYQRLIEAAEDSGFQFDEPDAEAMRK